VRLVVSDSGVGMAPEVQARIFEPFFTTKEIGRGTGLGLATVLGVVRQGGGAIWVESSPNAGAKFSVLLPCAEAERVEHASRAPGPLPRGSERVLLVDAEPAVRAATKNILVRLGNDVLAAKDADEALALSSEAAARIDLLLTDVALAKTTGPDLATKLVADHPSMRVVCMSGYLDDAALVERMSRGEVPFLQKPITPESLARKVREALDAPGSGASS
jgi:CheY-like chemotaxis protein